MNRILLVAIVVFATTRAAVAQEAPLQAKDEPGEIKVFSLENMPAAEAHKLLADVLGEQAGEGIAIDARRNTIVARSTPERLKVMEALLLRLDSTPPEPEEHLAVYRLRYTRAETAIEVMEGALRALQFETKFSLGIDKRTNSIVAMASPRGHQVLKSVLEELDQKEPKEQAAIAQSIRFEVYWVAEGEESGKLPSEIEQVFSDQAEVLGIAKPMLLASASVAAYIDTDSQPGPISLQGIKAIDGSELDCTAMITPLEGQSFKLILRLSAGEKSKTSIDTTIRTNLGHPVFVASTTTSNDSSKPTVFVLRITEQP